MPRRLQGSLQRKVTRAKRETEKSDVGTSKQKRFTFNPKGAGGGGRLGDRLGKMGRAEPIKVVGAFAAEAAA